MSYAEIMVIALGITAVMILGVSILLLKVIKFYVEETKNPIPFATPAEKALKLQAMAAAKAAQPKRPTLIEKLMGLRPLAEEKDQMMEHEFDGIAELDNPTPGWFMVLFYGTVIFAVIYLFNYEVFGFGQDQEEEYLTELAQAEEAKIAFLSKPGNSKNAVNENNIVQSTDAAVINSGLALYTSRCTPCHGEKGEGSVGPNLTDEYWLHGGTISDVFKTIKYGVPEKGMVAWEKSLSAAQLSDITNYVMSLQGTNPEGAKAPQGDKQL
ncbi:cbb3-type cytochrome c oxidase N-terminal domain-containing protein [Pedobacter sp.]|uniref:cbb3-type cytochrome c oxidase N-terminal domain-containing protein n=1 Tax=Pedobacter sp. TaxID=1411316 RepID=UPI003D7FDA08